MFTPFFSQYIPCPLVTSSTHMTWAIYHLYADYTQFYLSYDKPECPFSEQQSKQTLEVCIANIRWWGPQNGLKLNDGKLTSCNSTQLYRTMCCSLTPPWWCLIKCSVVFFLFDGIFRNVMFLLLYITFCDIDPVSLQVNCQCLLSIQSFLYHPLSADISS